MITDPINYHMNLVRTYMDYISEETNNAGQDVFLIMKVPFSF